MELVAEKRTVFGKKSKSLKKERKLPAVVFGKNTEGANLVIDLNSFLKVFKTAGETSLIDLKFDGREEKVLVTDVQLDPITMTPIHVSFNKVNLKEKISANIPVHVVGDELNKLVKSGAAVVLHLLNEIAVEALPTDLPSSFQVDVSELSEIGKGISIGQLKFDRTKVEIADLEDDVLVVKLDEAIMKEEVVVAEVTEEELVAKVEATGELTPEEKAEREAKDKAAKEAKEKEKEKK